MQGAPCTHRSCCLVSEVIIHCFSLPRQQGRQFDHRSGLARNSLKTGFQESLSELSVGTTDGRCRKSRRHFSQTRRIERNSQKRRAGGFVYGMKGTNGKAAAGLIWWTSGANSTQGAGLNSSGDVRSVEVDRLSSARCRFFASMTSVDFAYR